MNSGVLALVAEACPTMATMRATTVSDAARLTRTRSAPVPLLVAANTSSPGVLAGGSGSRPDAVAESQTHGVHGLLAAGLVEPDGLVGGEVEQTAHGLGGAVGGDR